MVPKQPVVVTRFYHPKPSALAYVTFLLFLIERELVLGAPAATYQSRLTRQQLFPSG